MGRIKTINMSFKEAFIYRFCMFIQAFLQIIDGLICVVSLTFYNPFWNMSFFMWSMRKQIEMKVRNAKRKYGDL